MIYQVLEEPSDQTEMRTRPESPQTLDEFIAEMKDGRPDAKTFAVKLKAMVLCSYRAFHNIYRNIHIMKQKAIRYRQFRHSRQKGNPMINLNVNSFS